MKLTYISILRSLSIFVVVFFHVYHYMYVPAHFPETVQMYHDAYNHVVLFPLMLTLSVIFVSWCLSWALMQTKVGRMLIG